MGKGKKMNYYDISITGDSHSFIQIIMNHVKAKLSYLYIQKGFKPFSFVSVYINICQGFIFENLKGFYFINYKDFP